jgi:hypothetical protein
MAIDITVSTVIHSDRRRLATFVMDHRNDPAWIGGISESVLEDDAPFGVGSRVRRVATFLGKRIVYVNEVDELVAGERLRMHSVKAPFPMVVTYSFADEGEDGTLATVRVQGDPRAMFRLATPVMARKVRSSVADDLRTLRRLMERDADGPR